MKNTRTTIFLAAVLLVLLGLLAFLQTRWLVQISQTEKEQAQKRLENDIGHFAEDFNNLIKTAYYPFQMSAGKNWQNEFAQHYQDWLTHAEEPELITQFSYISSDNLKYQFDMNSRQFAAADFPETFAEINKDFVPVDAKNLILRMPIHDEPQAVNKVRIFTTRILTKATNGENSPELQSKTINVSAPVGYLLIKLNAELLRNKILPALKDKYFSDGNYKLSVVSQTDNHSILAAEPIENADASVKIFALTPDNFAFFINDNLRNTLGNSESRPKIIFNRQVEKITNNIPKETNGNLHITVTDNDRPRFFQTNDLQADGIWTLNVQHVDGSLEKSAANARLKSLSVSFGILFLLGASIVIIFVTAQRARIFAQRQVDFVSSVSHEFRTPLAVIYSAGENLADGVTNEKEQVSRYGNLIKGEGKKLSSMVEQILDFAGANSGKKKYDKRETSIREIIESAIGECEPLLKEKEFIVETEFAENLPFVNVDKYALIQSMQNLIVNSVKYSNGTKYLKISANKTGGKINISVEDRGIGIAPPDLKHVFEPFFRAKSVVDEQIHGSGLGLSLVKNTIEAHQGKITVASEIGKGSKFIVELPTASSV